MFKLFIPIILTQRRRGRRGLMRKSDSYFMFIFIMKIRKNILNLKPKVEIPPRGIFFSSFFFPLRLCASAPLREIIKETLL